MSEKIHINMADAETLASISGIGPVLAARIIEYRQTVHPFEEVIELTAVPGISEKMVRSFEALVTVQPAEANTAVSTRAVESEAPLLLDAPEAVPLLAAETAATTATAEPEPAIDIETMEETEETEETAVPPNQPEIEALPLSDPPRATRSEPDLPPPLATHFDDEWETKARQRGCLNSLLGGAIGAILGAVLTLAILAALNQGTLSFTANDTELRQQLNTEIVSRTDELNRLSTRISVAATQEAVSNQSLQAEFATANETLNEAVAGNEENISYLATRSGALALQIEEVAGAADTFTDFLDGLRGLLNELEGGTATPTPTPIDETITPTPTPFSSRTPTAEPEATTAVSPTGVPTRTPQPTATPFTFATNTPAPQP
ncbi:MAG: helix-hairpin-helix domain-containing protein [Candidatus Promineifilaceae bacterium]